MWLWSLVTWIALIIFVFSPFLSPPSDYNTIVVSVQPPTPEEEVLPFYNLETLGSYLSYACRQSWSMYCHNFFYNCHLCIVLSLFLPIFCHVL